MKQVTIYTDGSSLGNPGPGGWGAVLRYGAAEKCLSGAEADTTNNRMELTATIEALNALREPCDVTLYTDSQYVKNGILDWMPKWRANNWRTANKKPVKNQDLWQALSDAVGRHQVTWKWVKGHAGNEGNEKADSLATSAARDLAAD